MSARGEVAVPYIKHPESVAKNLLGWGETEDSSAIGIAWGHDLLEDTETSLDEIIAASDDTIAAGIQLLTHEDETEKRCYLQNVARSPVFGQMFTAVLPESWTPCQVVQFSGRTAAAKFSY